MEKLATQLLNVFGYVNAKEEDVIVLEEGFEYLLVDLYHLKISFTRKANAWIMEEV